MASEGMRRAAAQALRIKIMAVSGRDIAKLMLDPELRVETLLLQLASVTGVLPHRQQLVFDGSLVPVGKSLADAGLRDGAAVTAVFGADDLVITASDDGDARLWSATTGGCLRTLRGHAAGVTIAILSADGRWALTAGRDCTARIWSTTTGQSLHRLAEHSGAVTAASFASDGSQVLTASVDRTAIVWSAARGAPLHVLRGHSAPVRSAIFSPGCSRVLTGSDDATAMLWSTVTGDCLHVLRGHEEALRSVAFSPDGAVACTAAGDVRLWDVVTGVCLRSLQETPKDFQVVRVCFSPDGSRGLTLYGMQGLVRIWDTASGVTLHELRSHTDWVRSASWSPDGAHVLTASDDGTAMLYSSSSGKRLRTFGSPQSYSHNSACFSPDGTWIVLASDDWTSSLWNVESGELVRTLRKHQGVVLSAAFSPGFAATLPRAEA